MSDRLLLLCVATALVILAVVAVRLWNRQRVKQVMEESGAPVWDSLGEAPDGRRAVVAFSTPSCAACHTAQAPAVKAVEAQLGPTSVRIISVDAARRPDVARAFGVLTVPTTIVLAPSGQVVAVNQGFAPSGRLVEQLQRA